MVLTTSVLFVLAIGIAAFSSHKLLGDEAENSARYLLDDTILEIEKTLQAVEVMVETASWSVKENLDNPAYLFDLTSKMVTDSKIIKGLALAFVPQYYPGKNLFCPYSYTDPESGRVKTININTNNYNYIYTDWYLLPTISKTPIWTEPYHSAAGLDTSIISFGFPILNADGDPVAVLCADIPIEWISGITEKIKPYESSSVSLFTRNGAYLHLNDDSRGAGETLLSIAMQNVPDYENFFRSIMDQKNGIHKFRRGNDYNFVVYGTMSNGWKAVIRCDYREVLYRVSNMNVVLILVALMGLVVLFFLCHYTIRRLTQPLMEFSKSARSIAEGNFNTELPAIKSDDEILLLRNSFQYMQKSLHDYIEELQTTTATKERIQSELNIASNIQMAMLPKDFPTLEGASLHAILHPAREVGGDLYDYCVNGDNLYFTIGDVSGKGVPACMFMAIMRSTFHLLASAEKEMGIAEMVQNMNKACSNGNDTNMFVTLFAGKLNLKTGVLEFCNAGHNPSVIIGPDGKATFMSVMPNLALGLFPDFKYQQQSITLEKGSRLLLYTDGVTEAEREDKSQYGEPRLLEICSDPQNITRDEREFCEHLYADVKTFVDGNEQNDDITILSIRLS